MTQEIQVKLVKRGVPRRTDGWLRYAQVQSSWLMLMSIMPACVPRSPHDLG